MDIMRLKCKLKIMKNDLTIWRKGLYLYNSGDQCIDITGGWAGLKTAGYTTSGTPGLADGVINSNNMYFTAEKYNRVGVGTINAIDLTNYSKLHIIYESSGEVGGNGSTLRAGKDKSMNNLIVLVTMNTTTAPTEAEVDISNYNGMYYLHTQVYYSSGLWGRIHKIWLE